MIGQCKLCLNPTTELQKSHYLSAGIYRILRDDTDKNPNPWEITANGMCQTSNQKKAYLLCSDCENLFNKNGENWVLRNCLKKDGKFPMASILASRTPDVSEPGQETRVYFAANIPDINISALSYFAASIFWRGSIFPWNSDGATPINLGPFQEGFRRYLCGLDCFPQDCSLWFTVREGKKIDKFTATPFGERKGSYHEYKFAMPGFAFVLMVSKNIPAVFRRTCFVHAAGNPIIMTLFLEEMLEDIARKKMAPFFL
jgi:hypothetical protein